MKRMGLLLSGAAVIAGLVASGLLASGNTSTSSNEVSPVFGVSIPEGYRDWKVISVAQEAGNFDQLRAQMGNDLAIKAYREHKLPFPDGSVIVALHWKREASAQDNKVFGREQAFVAGPFVNMQIMVKDSKKYASTGGWGFADFENGKPKSEEAHKTCFPCHEPAKAADYVFTQYAP
jgi:cytochrome P460